MDEFRLETDRLILRSWRGGDIDPFAAICADPVVMLHLGGAQSRAEVMAGIERQRASQARDGHCFWAVERQSDGRVLGFCGLRVGGHAGTAVEEELEIGWRLCSDAWGQGFAREAAQASLDWGFANSPRDRIAAWTVPGNNASWGLMTRLGMTHRTEMNFDHPAFPLGHPLSRHIVYMIERP